MPYRFLIVALAAGGVAGAAAAQPLPDFPAHARPGECWARVPVGPAHGPAHGGKPGKQSVWTLRQGVGPGAVWGYSERPAPHGSRDRAHGAGHGAPLGWARVDCASPDAHRIPPRMGPPMHGDGPPPGFRAPAPPPEMHGPGDRTIRGPARRGHEAPVRRHFEGPPPPAPEGAFPGGPPRMHEGRARAQRFHGTRPDFAPPPPPPPPPPHHPGMGPQHHGSQHHGPQHHGLQHHGLQHHGPMAHPPHFTPPPERQPVAPWFGGRFLTWPGKTIR